MKLKDRRKIITQLIRMMYSSLESHLNWTYTKRGNQGGMAFDVKCVREYSQMLKMLSDLL